MCCSAWPAFFSNTITGTWEVFVDGKINHVIWYQNRVGENGSHSFMAGMVFETALLELNKILPPTWSPADELQPNKVMDVRVEQLRGVMRSNNIEDWQIISELAHRRAGNPNRSLGEIPSPEPSVGNCLVIPLLGSWESIRLLNTTDVPNLLLDIQRSFMPVLRSATVAAGQLWGAAPQMVFLKFDIYDIVLAQKLTDVADVLDQIQPAKRPKINRDVFQALETWYNCPFAVCCFKDSDRGESKPLAFAFEPTYPDKLVVYTLDGHDGAVPNLKTNVHLDHTIFVGSYKDESSEDSFRMNYQDAIPDHLRPYVLDRALGVRLSQSMINGDILFSTADVRAGIFDGLRSQPPFAPAGTAALGWRVRAGRG